MGESSDPIMLKPVSLLTFVRFARRVMGTVERDWVPAYLDRRRYAQYRDWLIDNKLARWVKPDAHQMGWYIEVSYEEIQIIWNQAQRVQKAKALTLDIREKGSEK